MTNNKKGDGMGETCKDYLLELWLEEVYGRVRDFHNKYTDKGTMVEDDSMTLYSMQLGKFFKKNNDMFENEFITGHPDIITKDDIRDIKSCWDLFTFHDKLTEKVNKAYDLQLQGYMALVDRPTSYLACILVNTPDVIVEREKQKLRYSMPEVIDHESNSAYILGAAQIDKNNRFDDIPEKERWMHFQIDRRPIDDVYERVKECRVFMNELSEARGLTT